MSKAEESSKDALAYESQAYHKYMAFTRIADQGDFHHLQHDKVKYLPK